MIAACTTLRRRAVRVALAGLLAATAFSARAVVFTTDYDRLTVLPVLTGNPPDQDWRTRGAVNPVKNEGDCDSSWAFAVTGLVEGHQQIQSGLLPNLSEQELLDCTGSGSGCAGGSPIAALRTLIAKGGLASTASYPYTARAGICRAIVPIATIPGAGRVPPGDEVSLQNYVSRGPVLALVDASPAFESYQAGVFSGPCSQNNPTRAVLIVGYTSDHWIVKNSQGVSWGNRGYILMARNQNLCGIANYAVAVSNDPIPAVQIPALSARAVVLLLLGLATLGLLAIRRFRGD